MTAAWPAEALTTTASDRPRRRGGPVALRILLGAQLRRLRERKEISVEEAADVIRGSHSKISRMELGRVAFKERDVSDLLRFYGVTDAAEREALLALAIEANAPGWWYRYADILPAWFEVYVGLEEAASRICTYEVQFVPGLLQTGRYAEAVTRLGHPEAAEGEIERRVRLRMTRQRRLSGNQPLRLWAVIDEATLRRPLGGREVMREQIEHLLEIATRQNVTLQILPFNIGGHAATGGPFSILRFAEPSLPDMVYVEQLTSAVFLDKGQDTDRYLSVMERLSLEAESVGATRRILARLLGELDSTSNPAPTVSRDGQASTDWAADIYQQAHDQASRRSSVSYDVERGLQLLRQRVAESENSPFK